MNVFDALINSFVDTLEDLRDWNFPYKVVYNKDGGVIMTGHHEAEMRRISEAINRGDFGGVMSIGEKRYRKILAEMNERSGYRIKC